MLLEMSGLKVQLRQEDSLLRHSDEPLLLGNPAKIKALGWQRRYTIQETLAAVLKDWMQRVEG
jgi:GDP-4-dehydro-6-deoxy-D-mannose reductase